MLPIMCYNELPLFSYTVSSDLNANYGALFETSVIGYLDV